jgi:hypothetical protein
VEVDANELEHKMHQGPGRAIAANVTSWFQVSALRRGNLKIHRTRFNFSPSKEVSDLFAACFFEGIQLIWPFPRASPFGI